jgi:biotin-(acetyl-CoA carboxylase) ligase
LFEGRTRGKGQRTVLGIGLNKRQAPNSNFSSLEQLNPELVTENIVAQIHAIVASKFEFFQQPLIPFSIPQYGAVDSAIVSGSRHLGPLLYRGEKVEVTGVSKDGSLIVLDAMGASIHVDEPEDIEWSNIQFGI